MGRNNDRNILANGLVLGVKVNDDRILSPSVGKLFDRNMLCGCDDIANLLQEPLLRVFACLATVVAISEAGEMSEPFLHPAFRNVFVQRDDCIFVKGQDFGQIALLCLQMFNIISHVREADLVVNE